MILSITRYGQLGKGDLESRRWPVPVEKLNGVPIVQIDCGDQFSLALTVSGNVYAWGSNKVCASLQREELNINACFSLGSLGLVIRILGQRLH